MKRMVFQPKYTILALACVVFAVLLIYASHLVTFRLLDLENYKKAAQIVLSRQNPYGRVEFFAPPWMAFLVGPFLALPDSLASLVWILLNMLAICAAAVLSNRWSGAVYSRKQQIAILVAVTLMPGALFCYVTGQISPLIGFAAVLLAYLIAQERSRTALIVLCVIVVSFKPHIVALPVALCGLQMVRNQDWKRMAWIAASMGALAVLAFVLLPHWPLDLLAAWQQGDYRGGKIGLVSPGYTGLGELGISLWFTLPLAAYVFWHWWKRGLTTESTALSFTATLLVIPYSRSYDFVVLILPLLLLAARAQRRRSPTFGALAVIAYALPWTRLSLLTPLMLMLGLLLSQESQAFRQGEIQSIQ